MQPLKPQFFTTKGEKILDSRPIQVDSVTDNFQICIQSLTGVSLNEIINHIQKSYKVTLSKHCDRHVIAKD